MKFGSALDWLAEDGHKMMRHGWNGKNIWIALQKPNENSKMTEPYLYIEYPKGHPAYPNGSRVPWLASQTDILAQDWTTYVGPEDMTQPERKPHIFITREPETIKADEET